MTAERIAQALQARRSGRNWMARCPAHDDRSPSLSITERDGQVLVHCHAGCTQADVIAALQARALWPERELPQRTPAERADWARQQRELERALPDARYWRRAAVSLSEDVLTTLKAALFDPTLPRPDVGEIAHVEGMLTRLRAMEGAELVAEYSSWCTSHPFTTAQLVQCGRDRERVERAALLAYLRAV